jgi:hypothetical protein
VLRRWGDFSTYGGGGAATHHHRLAILNGAAVRPGGAAAKKLNIDKVGTLFEVLQQPQLSGYRPSQAPSNAALIVRLFIDYPLRGISDDFSNFNTSGHHIIVSYYIEKNVEILKIMINFAVEIPFIIQLLARKQLIIQYSKTYAFQNFQAFSVAARGYCHAFGDGKCARCRA